MDTFLVPVFCFCTDNFLQQRSLILFLFEIRCILIYSFFFSGQYFNNTLSRALHILLAWFPEGLGNQATHIACLLESVHHWFNVKVTPELGAAYLSNPRWDRIHTFSMCWQIYYHSTLTLIQVHIHIQAKEFYLF